MQVFFHVYCGDRAAVIRRLRFPEAVDASEILPLLDARSLGVRDNNSCEIFKGFKRGPLADGTTYHVYTANEERTRNRLETLAKISK